MKNLSVLIILVSLFSCKNRSDDAMDNASISEVGIDSVKLSADTLVLGNTLTATTYSTLKSGCEGFYKYDFSSSGLTKSIIAEKVTTNATCGNPGAVDNNINIVPKEKGSFNFKFKKNAATDTWITKTVLVK